MAELPEVTSIQRYTYWPGDKIIVTVPVRIDAKEARMIIDTVAARLGLPSKDDVLVLSEGIEITVRSAA